MEAQVGPYIAAPEKTPIQASGQVHMHNAVVQLAANAKAKMSLLMIAPTKADGNRPQVPEGGDLRSRIQKVHDTLWEILRAWWAMWEQEEVSAYRKLKKEFRERMNELVARKKYLKELIGGEITADDEPKEDPVEPKPDEPEPAEPGSVQHSINVYKPICDHFHDELKSFSESGLFTRTAEKWDSDIDMMGREADAIREHIDGQ